MSVNYKKVLYDNMEVQVQSAVCDGDGHNIANTYLKQADAVSASSTNLTGTKLYILGAKNQAAKPTDGTFSNSHVYISTTNVLMGAAWNDFAEYRKSDITEPGRVIIEKGDDSLILSDARMIPGAEIISDTFGFAIGETEECQTPIAAAGRVLAYGYEDREEFRKNIGHPVCSGPNGTVSIMSDDEYKEKGYCAIGFISAVPDYDKWGQNDVKVNDRIWIRIK